MKTAQLRSILLAGVHEAVGDAGFKIVKREEGVVRRIEGGRQIIAVPIWNYAPQFDFSMFVGIRIDAAEAIFHAALDIPAKYRGQSYTCVTQLQSFLPKRKPDRFLVQSEQDARDALANLQPILREAVVPFGDRYRDVAALDEGMNAHANRCIDGTVLHGRAMHAVMVAYLAGNPDWRKIVARYRKELRKYTKLEHEQFQSVVKHIEALRAKAVESPKSHPGGDTISRSSKS